MNATKKKALIAELSKGKNFVSQYAEANRRWFVDKVIRVFAARGLADAEIEQRTREAVTKSAPIVRARRRFTLNIPRSLVTEVVGRVELLYGLIAAHPELLETANSPYFDFLVRRSFRPVYRMENFVNPNGRGFFRYPKTCPSNERWRVNVDADSYWELGNANPREYLPIKLKVQPDGVVAPVAAINKIFTSKKKACEGNLFDCSTTLCILFMDSLMESGDPAKILSSMVSHGDLYVCIQHVNLNVDTNDYYLTDSGAEGHFIKQDELIGDFRVGDHVYIYNHPLYKVFKPEGAWRGEHSLIAQCGNRDVGSNGGFVFRGHGKQGTLYFFYNDFLKELRTDLERAYRIGLIHLAYLDQGLDAILPASVVDMAVDLKIDAKPSTPATHFACVEYKKAFEYRDHEKKPKPRKVQESDFVIAHSAADDAFYVDEKKILGDVIAAGVLTHPIKFKRASPAGSAGTTYDPAAWGIEYFDKGTNAYKLHRLYQRQAGKIVPRPLVIEDLFESPFMKKKPTSETAYMTRPRVDFSTAYQAFLRAKGAL